MSVCCESQVVRIHVSMLPFDSPTPILYKTVVSGHFSSSRTVGTVEMLFDINDFAGNSVGLIGRKSLFFLWE
jgi:hypothetical protein